MPALNKKISLIFLVVLIFGLVFFAWQYFSLLAQMREVSRTIGSQQVNQKVLIFSKMFVTDVLKGGQTISFDQRITLENAVRDIKDQEVYMAWQKFTNAKDQEATQAAFYDLFSLLLNKISPISQI